jgi:aspartate oxidase
MLKAASQSFFDDDDAELHEEVRSGGTGLCDEEAVEILSQRNKIRRELISNRVDRDGGKAVFTLEAAIHVGILHAHGDSTGPNS